MDTYEYLKVRDENRVTIVEIDDKFIDSQNRDAIARELLSLADDRSCKKVLLNLSGVEYLHSLALGHLVSLNKRLTKAGGELRICGAKPIVVQIFAATGITKLFHFFHDEQQALLDF